ncbi:coiled-coil domain-containing protein 115-like [Macrobrachium nipponense]|uniref:coiled-coil domain-containing protein 115-like n=1 Tax=Macrobrachium nipponense TaxID=159736 RepID=UPI0030C7BE17
MATSIQLSPESLCDGLDQLCIQKLELMDQLIKSNMMLESTMRGGFFMLSKTRYALGNKAVSSLQLPNEEREVDALATAVMTPVPLEGYEGDILYNHVDTKFQDPVVTIVEEEHEEAATDKMVTNADDQMEGLRRRFKSNEDEEPLDENGIEDLDYSERKVKTVNRDPIRWFTALPPQTLRQAQSEFKTAIQLVSQCATLKLKLRAVNKEYSRLKKIKAKLERLEKEP